MTAYADFEIGLYRRDADSYAVELRFTRVEDEAGPRFVSGAAHLNIDQLCALTFDSAAYGDLLGKSLFKEPHLLTELSQTCGIAEGQNMLLRARLLIGPIAPELHTLRWETTRDPQDGTRLFIQFSRYLSRLDWRPVQLRPRSDLRALVVIANPVNLAEYQPGEGHSPLST